MTRRSREPIAVVSVDRPRNVYRGPEPEARPRRGRKALRNLSLVVLLGGAIGGGVYSLQSNAFRVRHVTITGASAAVETSLGDVIVPGCDQLQPGELQCGDTNLGPNELTMSGQEIEHELERLPTVKSARVQPRLPDRLSVSIVERQPEAAWLVGSDTYRVAGDGMVIDRGPIDGLKVAVGQVGGTAVKPGDTVDPNVIKGAEQLQSQLPGQFGIAAKRIQYSPADGLAVIGDGDMIAMFGEPADLNLKMAELQRIMQLAGDKKNTLAFVDLRYKTPYYRTR